MRRNTSVPEFAIDNSKARKNLISYLVQAAFWIIIALIGFEIGLRYFVSGVKPMVSFDPVWGEHPVAGSVIMGRTEGNGITHYVADGEIATPYQGGANIPVLGDSHTEAWQVNDSQNYVSVAEIKLRGEGIQVDLRNLGYSGGTIADYAYLASSIQSKYQPSLVVIQISTEDFWGSGNGEGYFMSDEGNYFTKNADATLKVVHKPLIANYGLLRCIRGEFALLGYGQDRLKLFLQAAIAPVVTQPLSSNSSSLDQTMANYHAELTALHTAYQGQRVIILVLPYSPQIIDGQIVMENQDNRLLLDQVKQFGDWQVVDPLPAFQNLWLQDHKLPRGFTNTVPGKGHLNVDGHTLVGQLLAEKIGEMLK